MASTVGLGVEDLGDPVLGQTEQVVELGPRERQPLRRPLHLDEAARPGHHHVHVDLGPDVLGVLEVEHGHGVDDADRDGARTSR